MDVTDLALSLKHCLGTRATRKRAIVSDSAVSRARRQRTTGWADLPEDLLSLIFSHLDLGTRLKIAALVCKRWHRPAMRCYSLQPLPWPGSLSILFEVLIRSLRDAICTNQCQNFRLPRLTRLDLTGVRQPDRVHASLALMMANIPIDMSDELCLIFFLIACASQVDELVLPCYGADVTSPNVIDLILSCYGPSASTIRFKDSFRFGAPGVLTPFLVGYEWAGAALRHLEIECSIHVPAASLRHLFSLTTSLLSLKMHKVSDDVANELAVSLPSSVTSLTLLSSYSLSAVTPFPGSGTHPSLRHLRLEGFNFSSKEQILSASHITSLEICMDLPGFHALVGETWTVTHPHLRCLVLARNDGNLSFAPSPCTITVSSCPMLSFLKITLHDSMCIVIEQCPRLEKVKTSGSTSMRDECPTLQSVTTTSAAPFMERVLCSNQITRLKLSYWDLCDETDREIELPCVHTLFMDVVVNTKRSSVLMRAPVLRNLTVLDLFCAGAIRINCPELVTARVPSVGSTPLFAIPVLSKLTDLTIVVTGCGTVGRKSVLDGISTPALTRFQLQGSSSVKIPSSSMLTDVTLDRCNVDTAALPRILSTCCPALKRLKLYRCSSSSRAKQNLVLPDIEFIAIRYFYGLRDLRIDGRTAVILDIEAEPGASMTVEAPARACTSTRWSTFLQDRPQGGKRRLVVQGPQPKRDEQVVDMSFHLRYRQPLSDSEDDDP